MSSNVFSRKFNDSLRSAIEGELSLIWGSMTQQLRKGMYVRLRVYDTGKAELSVIDGCSGETLWRTNLSTLVSEFIKEYNGKSGGDDATDSDVVAEDFEKQAQRLRVHAAKLRQPNERRAAKTN